MEYNINNDIQLLTSKCAFGKAPVDKGFILKYNVDLESTVAQKADIRKFKY